MEKTPFSSRQKLFGSDAERVSNEELLAVVEELSTALQDAFPIMSSVQTIASKKDHGDIDILVLNVNKLSVLETVKAVLSDQVIKAVSNGLVKSMLFKSNKVGKTVHVDFIVSSDPDLYACHQKYYRLNDFSYAIGIVSKPLNFKYGSEGFFKRFEDGKGRWHNFLLSYDLDFGLRLMGYDSEMVSKIETYDQLAEFVKSSPLFDHTAFEPKDMKARDRQALNRRSGCNYLSEVLSQSKVTRTLEDEDHYFKLLLPEKYQEYLDFRKELNKFKKVESRFNGKWVMEKLDIKPGPTVGKILEQLWDKFADSLESASEEEVLNFAKTLL